MAKRKVKPKFFVFIAVFLMIIAAGVFLALKLKDRGKEEAAVIQATPVPTPPAEATPTPDPHLPENLTVHASSDANPSLFGFSSGIEVATEEVSSYTRKEPVAFGHPDEYTDAKGILTFGGNNYRNTFSYGTVDIQEQMLRKSWEQSVGGMNDQLRQIGRGVSFENITNGLGWIALGLAILALWHPLRAIPAALLFGAFFTLSFRLQGVLPPELLTVLPYLVTVLALTLIALRGGRGAVGAPEALGTPYRRGER